MRTWIQLADFQPFHSSDAVDCHPEDGAAVGGFIAIVRQTWGFVSALKPHCHRQKHWKQDERLTLLLLLPCLQIGPFWFPPTFISLGYAGSGGLFVGLVFIAGVLPIVFAQFWEGRKHKARNAATQA